MTGYPPDAVAGRWPADAGIEMLHKPLTQDTLEQKVRAALDQGR